MMVVGTPRDDDIAGDDQGTVRVYVRAMGGVWAEEAKLTGVGTAAGDRFGTAVAISGDTIVVGAEFDTEAAGSTQGSVYVFVRDQGLWTQQGDKLTATGAQALDLFGSSVAIDGDTLIAGSLLDDDLAGMDQGSASVFVRTEGVWSQQGGALTATEAVAGDRFGGSVDIEGDTVVIGAHFYDDLAGNSQGAAYVFSRSGVTWTQVIQLLADDAAEGDQFGSSVAISGDTIVIGAPMDNAPGLNDQGSTYVFTPTPDWTEQDKFTTADADAGARFGGSVGISGERIIVGAKDDDDDGGMGQGVAYVFERDGVNWTQQSKLTAADAAPDDEFGSSVGISGDTIVVGAPRDDDACPTDPECNSGSAYVYQLALAVSDCDGNGANDVVDILGGLATDCNDNFILDSCEIASNPALDDDINGIIDACEACAGDANDDGSVNFDDVNSVLMHWLEICP